MNFKEAMKHVLEGHIVKCDKGFYYSQTVNNLLFRSGDPVSICEIVEIVDLKFELGGCTSKKKYY